MPVAATAGSVARFSCVVSSSPPAAITWELNQSALVLHPERYLRSPHRTRWMSRLPPPSRCLFHVSQDDRSAKRSSPDPQCAARRCRAVSMRGRQRRQPSEEQRGRADCPTWYGPGLVFLTAESVLAFIFTCPFLAKVPTINPGKGPESWPVLRTPRRLSTRLWCWNAWPRGTPHPSSPGAAQTVNPLTSTTPRCWATETWSSPTWLPSTAGSTSAGPRPREPATTPSPRPISRFKVETILEKLLRTPSYSPARFHQETSVLVPPSFVERPESQTRPRAGTARFVCQAEGVPPPRISWLKNGEVVHLNGRIQMYSRYCTAGAALSRCIFDF